MLDVSLHVCMYLYLYTSSFIIFYIKHVCIYLSGTTIESPAVERSGERSCINIQSNTNTGYMYVCTVPGVQCRVTFYNATSNQYFVSFRLLASKSFVFEENKDNTTLLDDTITQLHSNENYS
jgi:hypothetical protein